MLLKHVNNADPCLTYLETVVGSNCHACCSIHRDSRVSMHQNLKSCPITVALLMPAKTKLDEKRLLVFPVIFPTGLFAVMHSKIGIFHLKYRLDIGYAHIIHYFSLEKVSTQLKDELWGKREVGGFLHLANNCKNYFGYKCWLTQFKES